MLLKNKKTGEIIALDIANIKAQRGVISVIPEPAVLSSPEYDYSSLAELCAEWEDVPEPKVGYIIDLMEEDCLSVDDSGYEESDVERAKELGMWFESEEEAKRAVEKLKAFKRLKDKGFRFNGYSRYDWNGNKSPAIAFEYPDFDEMFDDKQVVADLDICFEGEE